MPLPLPDVEAALKAIAEWAKGLPGAESISGAAPHALNLTRETGREYMLHQPVPPQTIPVLQRGTPSSVSAHPDMWQRSNWGWPTQSYNLHTHPGSWAPVYMDEPNPGLRGYETPLFSPGDLRFNHHLAQVQEPGNLRFAVATPQGSALGAMLRGHPEDTMAKLRGMGLDALGNLDPAQRAMWERRMQSEYSNPHLMGNLAATAPLFKAQGDLVEPLNYHFAPPPQGATPYDQLMQEYFQATHLAHGGLYEASHAME